MSTPTRSGSQREGTRQFQTRVYLALVGVLLAVAVLSAGVLWVQYTQILQNEQRRAENLAAILADHFARSAEGIEATLRAVALYSRQMGGPRAGDPIWQSVIEAGLAGLPAARALVILDENGIITHSTRPDSVGKERRGLPLFREVQASSQEGIIVDTMYRSVIDGTILIAFAHRLVGPNGKFAGVAVAGIEPSRLQDFYRIVDAGPGGIVWAVRPSGEAVFRETPARIGEASPDAILAAQRARPDGSFNGRLAPGGPSYVTGYRTLSNPPLVLAVSFAEKDVLAGWRNEAAAHALILALMAIALMMAGMFIGREVHARSHAEARYQAILDHVPLAFSVKDADGRYAMVNRAFEKSFSIDARTAIGRRPREVIPEGVAELAEDMDRRVRTTALPVQSEFTSPDLVNPNAQRRTLMIKFPLFDARGQVEAIGTVGADITEQHLMKEQLVHTRKMESLGQLTGGIAHDFNNLLTTILLNAGILCSQLANPQLHTLAREINSAAERGSQLTKRLLSFARRQWLDPQPTDIGELVASMGDLMRRVLGSHVEVEIAQAEGGPHRAMIDPGQLENALLNLAVNARDAMPEGGRLTIRTGYRPPAAEGAPGQIEISVADTGTGMPPDVLARACEPFFTTKGVGKGTGLGLSMVYGFLKQSGGQVDIQSELGVGTTVILLLPEVSEGVMPGDDPSPPSEATQDAMVEVRQMRAAAG